MSQYRKQKKLRPEEAAAFCGQMYLILKSGISAAEGISIMLEDAQSDAEKAVLSPMYECIVQQGLLTPAIEASGVFPEYLVHMIALGEETGTLDEVMHALQAYYEREDAIEKSIRSALTYPLIMIAMMILIIVVLITEVMPIFQQVFRQLGREMTGLSKAILSLGTAMTNDATAIIAVLILLFLVSLCLSRTESGRKLLVKIGYHFRFSRAIYEKTSACRFAGGMYLSLKSGLNPEQALEFSGSLIEDPMFRNKIIACKKMTEEGEILSHALKKSEIFTGVYAKLTAIAGRSGSLDEVMAQIAERYEAEVQERVTALISCLEPTLVIILSVIVGVILFSVMLPLLGIMSAL